MIELFSCEARRQIRSIVSLCEEFGARCTRAKRANQNDFLELCVLRSSWERNHIANIAHTCYEEQETLETESEARVRC